MLNHRTSINVIMKALYHGNGEPPLVKQVALNTQSINTLTKIMWIVVTAVIGNMVMLFFRMVSGSANDVNQNRMMERLATEISALNRTVSVAVQRQEEKEERR